MASARNGKWMLWVLLVACRRDDPAPLPAPVESRVPAPQSSLAQLLGADDAGCGMVDVRSYLSYCGKAPQPDRDRPLGRGPGLQSSDIEAAEYRTNFFAVRNEPHTQSNTTSVRLRLSGGARAETHEMIVLTLELTNVSAAPIVFARSVGGSFHHLRSPIVETYARDTSTGQTYVWSGGTNSIECGTVDPRKPSDYTMVKPGSSVTDPFGPLSFSDRIRFTRPGRYLVWTVYAACEGLDSGEGVPRPADLFPGPLVSNTHEITVSPRP